MLKDRDIICISSIDWGFIWQGHQEIMSALADNGNRVLFIENTGIRTPNLGDLPRLKSRIYNWLHSVKGIRKERENLYIYSPLILPFPYSRIARWINRHLVVSVIERWVKSSGFSNPIIWTFLPTGLVLDIINSLDPKLVVYYCIDNLAASSLQARRIKITEDKLLRKADLVFVTAKSLYDRCSGINGNVHVFPYGVNMTVYEKARGSAINKPAGMDDIKHPIIGYVGGIHKWIDFSLVKSLAEASPDKSFVFVGPLQRKIDEFKNIRNVHFLGQKNYEELPSYVANFDICFIPYMITDYTRNVYPTKLNEYLAVGKPVISTPLPEVEAFNMRHKETVCIGQSVEEFLRLIDSSLSQPASKEVCRRRMNIANEEGNWKTKIEKMSDLIEKKLLYKERERDTDWKAHFLKLYGRSKKRFIPALAVLGIVYFLLFYTPLVWLAAEPLKVSDMPEKSDAIVVLAGGVGESGKAGQGYEERVQYAVELYKKGYADKLIFSSGYMYVFKEPLVMKALAVSLGVPDGDIILEDKAVGTRDNVLLTKNILEKKGWDKILLVSSPYHMRRVSMVFNKIAKTIRVCYLPVIQNKFYEHTVMDASGRIIWKRINLKQIRGIIHEYLAILYYRFKGYV